MEKLKKFVLPLVVLQCATSCVLMNHAANQCCSVDMEVYSFHFPGGDRLYEETDRCQCNPPEYDYLDACLSMKTEETLFFQNLARIRRHYQGALLLDEMFIEKLPAFLTRREHYGIRSIFVQGGYGGGVIDNTDEALERNGGKPIVYEQWLKEWMIPAEILENAEFEQLMYRNRDLALTTIAVIELGARLDIWLIPHEAPNLHRIFTVGKKHVPLSRGCQEPCAVSTVTAEKILEVCSNVIEHEKDVLTRERWGFWMFSKIHLLSDVRDISNMASRERFIRENFGNAVKSLPCLYLSAGLSRTMSQHHKPGLGLVGATYDYLYGLRNEGITFFKRCK